MTHDPLCRIAKAIRDGECCADDPLFGYPCDCNQIAKAHKRGYEEAEAFYTNSCVSCGYAGEWSTWMCEQCTLEQP